MPEVTAAVLVCEYLFTVVKVKDRQSVEVVRKRKFFRQNFLSSFTVTLMVQHDKVYF